MTGGSNTRRDLVVAAQRNLVQAQKAATAYGARAEISSQGSYENRLNPVPAPDLDTGLPNPIHVALNPTDTSAIASGAAQYPPEGNRARQAKGATGPSAYIPSMMLDEIRFGGSPAGDLFNLVRQAGTLPFPDAFDDPSLAKQRSDLEQDFATAAAAVLQGQNPESAKVAKLERTFQQFQDGAGVIIKELPFEEAIAARRFLNSMANAIKALKNNLGNGLVNPRWAVEGLTVADLTRQMTKHKLQFAPAPSGGEETYSTMQQNLATYLYVLNQPKK